MTGNTHYIVKHLFSANSLDAVSLKQVEDLSNKFPFFNVGHYLLSKKLHLGKTENFLDETQKTALYFHNPFWLQWLLQNSFDETLPEIKTYHINEYGKTQIKTNEQLISREATGKSHSSDHTEQPGKKIAQEDALIFEPYHTLDYFASQGIKFVVDEKPNDKLGRQLKSFTEWLKTMKKLPQKNAESSNIETAEQAVIEGYAAHSIQQKEIITEAMAEVLAKQGKNEDAVGLYQKLSLLNPAKSAYFAAKIEQLNIY